MADLTLHDLISWEPRLTYHDRPLSTTVSMGPPLEREISWAVSARATSPMLGGLRGGEIVLIAPRVLSESGVSLPIFLRELASHGVSAVILERPPDHASSLPVVLTSVLSVELETEINRLLTEKRGELYRSGTELSRSLSAVASAGGDLGAVLRSAAAFLGAQHAVLDRRGVIIQQTNGFSLPPSVAQRTLMQTDQLSWSGSWLLAPLPSGSLLCIGPVRADRRSLARLAAERVSLAVEEQLQRAAERRPRGAFRSGAITSLLTGTPDEANGTAAILGLPANGSFRVALAASEVGMATLNRLLQPLGTVHEGDELPIGHDRTALVALVELPAETSSSRMGRAGRASVGQPPNGWLALSATGHGPPALPQLQRQATFLAGLLVGGHLTGPVVHFEALAETGVYRLLYELWGSPAAAAFARDALGGLAANDRKGTLRETLLAFLAAGGSHVETAGALGIHRNTLAYRLKQIRTYTGQDPTEPMLRVALHLALLIETMPAGG